MANTITGRILVIGNTESIPYQDKIFYKRELVIDASRYDQWSGQKIENYPRFELSGNNCMILDSFKEGDLVEVSFYLSGRQSGKDGIVKYFTNIMAYKVEKKILSNYAPQQTMYEQPPQSINSATTRQPEKSQAAPQPPQQTFPPATEEPPF